MRNCPIRWLLAALLSSTSLWTAFGGPNTLVFEGQVRYTTSGNQITVSVDTLRNTSTTLTTGTLYFSLRFPSTPDRYAAAHLGFTTSDNSRRGLFSLNRLGGGNFDSRLRHGSSWTNIQFTTGFNRPPDGTYYPYLVVYQYDTSLPSNGATTQIGAARFNRVTVGNTGGGGGGGDDHGNSRSTASVLRLGGSVSGQINPAGDVDYFRFDVFTRTEVRIYSTSGSGLDPVAELYNSRGSRLAYNDDGGGDRNFEIVQTLNSGTYYVRVRAYGNNHTGNYTLFLRTQTGGGGGGGGGGDDHGNSRSSATVVLPGASVAGVISPVGDVDYFRFYLAGERDVRITSSGTTTLDPVAELYNSAGSRLVYADDSGGSHDFEIVRRLAAGTYYLRVRAFRNDHTGAYTVRFGTDSSMCP